MRRPLLSLICCLAGLMFHPLGPVHAAEDATVKSKPAKKAAKPRAGPSGTKLIAPEGSGETAAARAARLKRECKGRPNAGACSGHTD